jgi:predicted DNA-binding protein YlxM (UPF0122 family)
VNYPTKPPTEVTADRRRRIAEYLEKDLSVREIADLLGITTQAVYLHIRKLRQERTAS